MKKILALAKKHQELILYLVFGVCTTLVYLVAYFAARWFANEVFSTIIGQFIAVTFAFIVNKKFVFKSKTVTLREFFKQAGQFYSARLVSFFIDLGITWVFISHNGEFFAHALGLDRLHYPITIFGYVTTVDNPLKINELFFKFFGQIIIVVSNFLFSKLVIFKKKNTSP